MCVMYGICDHFGCSTFLNTRNIKFIKSQMYVAGKFDLYVTKSESGSIATLSLIIWHLSTNLNFIEKWNWQFIIIAGICYFWMSQNSLMISYVMLIMSGHDPGLSEWEYMPPVGPRPHKGFVGLKNAGATCYMNSVLQQVGTYRTDQKFWLNVISLNTVCHQVYFSRETN